MKLSDKDILRELGKGTSIADVCAAADITREQFDTWWQQTTAARVPQTTGSATAALGANVEIRRNSVGIPQIFADNDRDLFVGFGFAMAQDRLFQLDYLRRKGHGRLAEILGPAGLEFDTIARTVGLNRIAAAEWKRLPTETQTVLQAFSDGVNAHLDSLDGNLPIEFDLLDYRPEAWSPIDCLAIETEFRWYLTGRFPVIVMPELAKRTLGEGALYADYLLGEADDEAILPAGTYPAASQPAETVGQATSGPDANTGSNNWVVDGRHSTSGKPLVASDPHIAFEAVSCWYNVHLCGGSFNVAGTAYVGMPAVMIGRNTRVAWGITNNISSQRDLYQERTDPAHADCFLYDGEWQPARSLTETINVRGASSVEKTIRFSKNGPIVDDILPAPATRTGPVSLKWLGDFQGGWLTALLGLNRASDADSFREAARPWHVPTFNLVFADVEGHIGMQTTGRIPIRNRAERGYRRGWDPVDQWDGLIPFEGTPHIIDPERGWMATANNRLAYDDYPHPLAGTWGAGHRCRRIREMIEAGSPFTPADFRRMQQDALNLRARECVPALVKVLQTSTNQRILRTVELLAGWNCESDTEAVGATLFNVFFTLWCEAVARERFDDEAIALLCRGVEAVATRLLVNDPHQWFTANNREEQILAAYERSLDYLTERLGDDVATWKWGRLHSLPLKHVLSTRGELSQLLDHGGKSVPGDMMTVCNTNPGPDFATATGAGFRMVADLSADPPVLSLVDAQSQSGHPGSAHYSDQLEHWLKNEMINIALLDRAASEAGEQFFLQPG